MGLIRAGRGALDGILADQWKEFFYCDSMGKDVLVTKGQQRNCCCGRTVYVDRGAGKGR